jgi:3-methyladenine DNA glycosylase AlkD
MRVILDSVKTSLGKAACPDRAAAHRGFFKTEKKSDYGYGDKFIGVRQPEIRAVVKEAIATLSEQASSSDSALIQSTLALSENLLASKIHEERMAGALLLSESCRPKRASLEMREAVYNAYMSALEAGGRINNWDIVDVTCPEVVGQWLYDMETKSKGKGGKALDILLPMARSNSSPDSLWQRRVAVISTLRFVRLNSLAVPLAMCECLVSDPHDLLQKAVGWVLREVGKKSMEELEGFLDRHAASMPRTALRYSIEKMDQKRKGEYMGMKGKRLKSESTPPP